MKTDIKRYIELGAKTDSELRNMLYDEEHPNQSTAAVLLMERLSQRIHELEKAVAALSGQDTKPRKRKIFYYEGVELTDELLVEYIDDGDFTIYELEKLVGAKKNVLRGRYIRAKKRIQAKKCQNSET
jgi:hypothetical protein